MRPALVVLLMLSLTPFAQAQEKISWVLRLGRDTLSVEQFTRTANQVRGEYVVRTPRTQHRTYVMDLNPDGTVRKFDLVTRNLAPGPGAAETRASVELIGDSAIIRTPRGDSTVTTRIAAARGAVPTINGVMGIMDQIAHQARAAGGASYEVALLPVGPAPTLRGVVSARGPDTLLLVVTTPVGEVPPFTLVADRAGNLRSFSGRGSVFQADAERVPAVDLAAAGQSFANRPVGQLSTRDTVRAKVGAAEMWVDYGRPFQRGREIFGTVVPWNTVWRTGANAATQFHTSSGVTIGGAKVPAGTYTLWTLPTAGGWKLIVNKQSGQWGTQYDPTQDLARVDMRVEKLPQPVEQLTIAIDPAKTPAVLTIAWDRTRASVPVAVAK